MQLLQHFKELSLHPKNAKELKGLILQLAIQGKLTAKWREGNPDLVSGKKSADNRLNNIKLEKEQLIRERKIKKEQPFLPVLENQVPFELPDSWIWCRLVDISKKLGAGSTPLGGKTAYAENGIKFLRSQNVYNDGLRLENAALISNEIHLKMKGTHVKTNDLLLNITGGSIGRCAIVPKSLSEGNVSQHVAIVRMVEEQLVPFVHILIISKYFQDEIMNVQVGVSREGLSMAKLKLFPTPIPPELEQKQILKTVNQLFKEVEQLEQLTAQRVQLKEHFATSALKKLTEEDTTAAWSYLEPHFKAFFNTEVNIKQLRETILQLAVQGKLTSKWRNEHSELISGENSATKLLQKIKAEKEQLIKDKKIKKEKPLSAISDDEIPYTLPDGWVWCRLGELVRFMAYGTSQKTDDNHLNVPVLRMGNITSEGKLHYNNLKYISSDHRDLPKLYLVYGDLVFNRTNSYDLVGKSGVYRKGENEYTLASYLIKVSLFNEHIDSDYINNYIISQVCRKTQIEPQITAQTNQANFSGSKLKEVLTPVAPTIEQNIIVEKVNSLMAFCDQLEQEVKMSKKLKEDWMRAVLLEEV